MNTLPRILITRKIDYWWIFSKTARFLKKTIVTQPHLTCYWVYCSSNATVHFLILTTIQFYYNTLTVTVWRFDTWDFDRINLIVKFSINIVVFTHHGVQDKDCYNCQKKRKNGNNYYQKLVRVVHKNSPAACDYSLVEPIVNLIYVKLKHCF